MYVYGWFMSRFDIKQQKYIFKKDTNKVWELTEKNQKDDIGQTFLFFWWWQVW